jgi:hypothetical protein
VFKTNWKAGPLLDRLGSRWSLAAHVWGAITMIASFGLPAWATWAAGIFSQYAPLSWIVAGFAGLFFWSLYQLTRALAHRILVNAKYDARFIERGQNYNPLDLTFERKRIYLDDFSLPSHTIIEGKTFIDCDIIGPATIYFKSNNLAQPIRPPRLDAVWLHPTVKFTNGFTFDSCIFRNCSFQRITMLASIENYDSWKDNPNVNWISLPPSDQDIKARQFIIEEELKRIGVVPPPSTPVTPTLIEHGGDSQGDDARDVTPPTKKT